VAIVAKYRHFFLLLIIWIGASLVSGPLNITVVVLSMFLLKAKNRYTEMIAGLWFLCTMSDNALGKFSHGQIVTVNGFDGAKYACMILLVIFLFFDIRKFSPLSKFYSRFVPFFVVALYCLLYAPYSIFIESFSKTLSYFILIYMVPNYVNKSYRDDGLDFLKLLIYVAIFVLSFGLLLKVTLPDLVTFDERYRGLMGNPNGMGLYCLTVFLLFALTTLSFPELFSRWEKILFYLLLFGSVFLCGSRNTIVAILVYIMFSYLTSLSTFFGFIVFLLVVSAYGYIDAHIVDIVKSLGLENYFRVGSLNDAAGRYIAWQFAWDHISSNIFLGHGFEYTDYVFHTNQDALNALGHNGNAHSSFLTFWLDTGLIGLLLFLYAFIGTFLVAARRNKVVVAALFAILFSAVFESYLTASLNPFTCIIVIFLTVLTNDEIFPLEATTVIPLH